MAAPVFTNISPAVGSPVTPTTLVGVDMTDTDDDIALTQLAVIFLETGDHEVVYDSLAGTFSARYLNLSSRAAITNGFRFVVGRAGGWPLAPTLRVTTFDTSSLVTTANLTWTLGAATGPAPTPPAFIPPAFVPGADIGQVERGCGILAPFRRDGKGDFENGCGLAIIKSSVARIIGVQARTDHTRGDLRWRPEFGSQVTHARHAPSNVETAEIARFRVLEALRIWEPRIEVIDAAVTFATVTPDGGVSGVSMDILVRYRVLAQTRGAGTLVDAIDQRVTLPQAA